jgi:uncharacterized repeat protein (TIGR03803 family)
MKRTFGALLTLCLATVTRAQITQIFTFPCPDTLSGGCVDGYRPNVLPQASDGNFYGAAQLTTFGSSNPNGGTLFRVTTSGHFTLLFTFKADANGNYANGNNPATALVEANDGFLNGASFEGGGANNGVLFRISKSGSGFTVLHSFCSAACPDGSIPVSLIQGHDGNLYGTTLHGGSSASGTIFRFAPPGSFTTIHELNGTTDGAAPSGMIQAADGNYYGTISDGVFRLTPGGAFTVLTAFPLVDGFLPTSGDSPLVQGSNGKLYGALTTYSLNQVQFYEINPSGGGFQEFPEIGTLSVDFHIGSLIQASNGDLWTAFTDTANPNGVVVAMSPSTGAVVQSFSFGGTNGSGPEAGVIQGTDGKIYGTAIGGGTIANGNVASGTVWSLDAGLPAPKPGIAAFSPTSGAVGSAVLIRGTKFVGTTAVTFNGISAVFQVLNAQFIRATVPAGGSTGLIEVTNAGGTAATAKAFVVQ